LADANLPKRVAPATAAAADIEKDVPTGNVPTARVQTVGSGSGQLQAPEEVPGYAPLPGTPTATAPGIVYVRQNPAVQATAVPVQQVHQPTPEEQRIAAAYEAEQRAMAAPTDLSGGFGAANAFSSPSPSIEPSAPAYSLASGVRPVSSNRVDRIGSDDQSPATTTPQEAFVQNARTAQSDDYLKSIRTSPISQYEIKAGWEIPAVMEQGLNSDLPGEVKALVTSNVYDTATGRYVLIPQGARLVGAYNSQLGYGQDGVQVIWNRVIYPDGSSLDLSGMLGQDAHGFSGFREKVDHHYKRLIGFAVLTSMFAAVSNISQNQNRSVLAYPSPGEVAGSAVGQQVSDLGAQVTRKNLNVQPTVKIPVGYQFNVRVNRDVVFDSAYSPQS
jgi:type IV secretion system protein VirB10